MLWLVLGVVLLSPATTRPHPGHLRLDLVLSATDPPYEAVVQGLLRRLDSTTLGRRIRRDRLELDEYVESEASLVVAVGMRACERVAEKGASPVFCIFIPESAFRGLTQRLAEPNLGALFIDQPIIRQFALARVLFPDAEMAGLLAGSEAFGQEDEVRRSARAMDFSLQMEPGAAAGDVARAIRRLLKQADVVVAMFEPELLTPATARWLLQVAHYRRKPVIGYSQAYVEAGALAAVFSAPGAIGEQAAVAILDWAERGSNSIGLQSYPSQFEVALNQSVAVALGIEPSSRASLARRVAAILEKAR